MCYAVFSEGFSWEGGHLEMLKLLIADTVEEFRQSLADQVRGAYRIRICQEGHQTLETILSFKPDLVVLDMMLPGLDGVSILEAIHNCGMHPVVLAVTKYPTDYMVQAASRYGVGYMMLKPCDVKATAARLKDLAEQMDPAEIAVPDLRTVISNILLNLGFSTKLQGYVYLREAIVLMANEPGQGVTKVLYPAVGKICGANKDQVERSIRNAIDKAWQKRDEAMWRLYFPVSSDGTVHRPTNAVFIATMADRLNMDRGVQRMCKMQKESHEKL